MEKVYRTTLHEYKVVLRDWYAGTGGGSGDSSMFQDWSEEKLNKYDVDPKIYDHSNVKERPSILMDNYAKKKKYITMIFLWDELKDLILASKYDPLQIGIGEAGLSRDGDSTARSKSRKESKKKTPEEEAQIMMKTVVDMFYEKEEASSKKNRSVSTISDSSESIQLEESLSDLMKLYEIYMNNLKFHKDNGTCSKEREDAMIAKIDNILALIEDRTNRKRPRTSSNSSNVS